MTIEQTLAEILVLLKSIDQSLKGNSTTETEPATVVEPRTYVRPNTMLLNKPAAKGSNSHIRSTRAIQPKDSAPAEVQEQKVSSETTTQTTADIIAKYAPNLTGNAQNTLLRK